MHFSYATCTYSSLVNQPFHIRSYIRTGIVKGLGALDSIKGLGAHDSIKGLGAHDSIKGLGGS